MPDVPGKLLDSQVCMFTNTPDEDFLIDLHPGYQNVVIASPCSGHGFKFASAIGEILADLATVGESKLDFSMFGLDRLNIQ
jgi:sarcosine oxidase